MSAELPDDVALMDGPGALPRDNGELVFAAPWEGRALALAVALVERLDLPWDAFRQRLIDRRSPKRPNVRTTRAGRSRSSRSSSRVGLATPATLDAATPTERAPL